MKRVIQAITTFIIATLFFPIINQQPVEAAWLQDTWYNDEWGYRVAFTVTNDGAELTNYQLEFDVNYGTGTNTGFAIYCNSHSQTDFDDIRFTQADGATELYYWKEEYIASDDATFWVGFDVLPAGDRTFYMYYGNASAVDTSDISNTFLVGDDFERGADGDAVGGDWTVAGGTVQISTAHSVGTGTAYTGTRATKFAGDPARPIAQIDVDHSDNIEIRVWVYKEDAADFYLIHGNGTYRMNIYVAVAEDIYYVDDGGNQNTGSNLTADSWQEFYFTDFDWGTNQTYDIYLDASSIQDDADMQTSGATSDVFYVFGENVANNDLWIDNLCVRQYRTTDPPTIDIYRVEEEIDDPVLDVQDAKVFQGYRETDDWLIAIRYVDVYPPYYDTYDVKSLFVLRLIDSNSTVQAQTVVPAWGNRPGCIYLSADQVTGLDYGGDYVIRLTGVFTGTPYTEFTLSDTDWYGSDLTGLDSWVISSASTIGTYYSTDLTTYIAERGEVLNATGGGIFDNGINGLASVRPNVFQTYTQAGSYNPETWTQSYRHSVSAWQTNIGATATAAVTRVGNVVGVGGDIVMLVIMVAIMAGLAVLAFPAGHTTAALALSIGIFVSGVWLGIDLNWILMLALISGLLLAKQFILDKGA